jgi:hypothetical protein
MAKILARAAGPATARRLRNTAEPSGELSVGDVVAVGEAGLAVGRAGWTPIRGGLKEVRTSEHGTCSLPASAGTAPGGPRIEPPGEEPSQPWLP